MVRPGPCNIPAKAMGRLKDRRAYSTYSKTGTTRYQFRIGVVKMPSTMAGFHRLGSPCLTFVICPLSCSPHLPSDL